LITIALLLLLLTFNSGCDLSEFLGFMAMIGKADKDGAGTGSLTLWSGLRQMETIEQTVNSAMFTALFQNVHKSGQTKNDGYAISFEVLVIAYLLFWFFDPLIVQFPEDATNFSGTYDDYGSLSGSLVIQSGLQSVMVTPGVEITAEPGHQLVIIDLPADHDIPVPVAGDPEKWVQFALDFEVNPAREIQVKCMNAGKVTIDGQDYYLPLCPVTTDFAEIPPITIPMADTPQNMQLPAASELPHPAEMVVYDFSSLMESTTMYFPRLQFTPDQGTEGYGFVNPKGEDADVVFTAFDATGAVLATSATYPWLSGRQNAYQADGIFGFGSATDAWVKAESTVPGLLGFFLSQEYDSGIMAGLDGTGVFTRPVTDGVIPRVTNSGDYWTELYLANPGDSATTVNITGHSATEELAGGDIALPPGGFIRTDLATLFPDKAAFEGCLSLQSPEGIIGTATIGHATDSLASANVQDIREAAETLYASHIVRYPGVYMTSVTLLNTTDTPATATLSPFYADGTAITAPFTVDIGAGKTVTLTDGALGLPADVNTEGWLRVDCPGHPLMGSITFADPAANRYESTLPLQPYGYKDFYYAQVANGQVGSVNYSTGLAILNPSPDMAVDVVIFVHLSDGSVNGEVVARTLQPGEKYVRELRNIEDIGNLTDQASGYLHITASGPVFSFVLFYDAEANFMSAVQPQY
jgi:hypothetical protein